ncbi:MAG: Rpn family recombination-promoting nuclease/putative transposase, partial [Tannerellaceae bacterium]|nr:Rpn family recombination-promoting nuclease/putative transposase [Tannerellaceae bacterium]
RDKANFEVPEGFLSELQGREVRITGVLESESNKLDPLDKCNRIDVVVEDREGEIILIELQFILEIDYFQRMLYGVSKAIVEHMMQGDRYREIRKIYSVNIVYFDLGHGQGYAYLGRTEFRNLYDSGDILELSEKQRKIFGRIEAGDLYPEYYVLKINKFNDVAKTKLDEWIYFLKNDRIKEGFNARGLLKARELLDYSRLSPEEKAAYDYEQEAKSHYLSQIASAKLEGSWELEKKLEEKEKAIEEKEKVIEENKKAIEEKEKMISKQAQEIEELKRLLNSKGTSENS